MGEYNEIYHLYFFTFLFFFKFHTEKRLPCCVGVPFPSPFSFLCLELPFFVAFGMCVCVFYFVVFSDVRGNGIGVCVEFSFIKVMFYEIKRECTFLLHKFNNK